MMSEEIYELVTIATVTWARTEDEETLLRRSLQRLTDVGARIVTADARSGNGFSAFLHDLPGLSVAIPTQSGLVAQVKASIGAAALFNTPLILYTEPDKHEFFDHRLAKFIHQATARRSALTIAARSSESFETFPPMQRYAESVINHLCSEVMRVAGDYCYGPFVMPNRLSEDVADVDPALGWGWRPFLFRAAQRRGIALHLVSDDHPCPKDQQTEDENDRMHRLRQLAQNVSGLIS